MISLFPWSVEGFVAGLIAAFAVIVSAVDPAGRSTALTLSPCHLDDLAEEVRCAVLEVFEDRDTAAGRRIPIHVTVLPALVRDPAPDPFVVLAGGPGQGARAYAPLVPRFFQRIRRLRDVVLVDLRGTGDSAPLTCATFPGTIAFLTIFEAPEASARRCLAGLDADPRFYTHREALADLQDVLRGLGYERVNLWGGSWGTRSALIFAAAHPDLVRTAVLDGAVAATVDFPWSHPRDAQRALDRLFDDCARDAACHTAFPHARDTVRGWLAGLDRKPFVGTIHHPRSAARVEVRVDRPSANEAIRAALYSPLEASRLVMAIDRAAAGDLSPLVAMAERAANWSIDTMALGQTMSILCSEDVGRHPAPTAPDETLFGHRRHRQLARAVRSLAERPGARHHRRDRRARTGADSVWRARSGDPACPWRSDASPFSGQSPHCGPWWRHNVSFSGCLPRLIAEFVEQGSWQVLDPSCAKAIARPFVTSFSGERP